MFSVQCSLLSSLSPTPLRKRRAITAHGLKTSRPLRAWCGHADSQQITVELVNSQLGFAFTRTHSIDVIDRFGRLRWIVLETYLQHDLWPRIHRCSSPVVTRLTH